MPNASPSLVSEDPAESTGPDLLILGDTYVASTLSRQLGPDVNVRLVTDSHGVAMHARHADVTLVVDDESGAPPVGDDVSVVEGEFLSDTTFRAAGVSNSSLAVVAMSDDSRALLATQLLRTRFDSGAVVAVVDDPRCENAFADVTAETVCLPRLAASNVESLVSDRLAARQNA